MEFSKAFIGILNARGYNQRALAAEVDVKPPSISSMLKKNNPSVDALSKYLRVLGYDIALVPVGAKLPEGSYVITKEEQ